MSFLLDTNACIRIINGQVPALLARLAVTPSTELVVPSIAAAELWFGAEKSAQPARNRVRVAEFLGRYAAVDFGYAAAQRYGEVRAALEAGGTPIGPNDLLIAAMVLAGDHTLVTHNVREFTRVPGLRIEDWESAAN